jgi:Ca2+-binding EF-hand superfamily protein
MASLQQQVVELGLTREEIYQYKRRFAAFDRNRNGFVDLREFVAVSKAFGYKVSKEDILEIFGRSSLEDESVSIGFEEFVIALHKRKLKAKEWAPYRESFMKYDVKRKGYITAEDAYPILAKELGFDLNKTESFLDIYDKNKDYRLSLQEFIDFSNRIEELKQSLWDAFNMFDKDADGFISFEEAKEAMVPKGFSLQQIQEAFRKYDSDGDSRWSMSEFAAFWDIPIF